MESLVGHTFNGMHMVGGGIQNQLLCGFTANAIGRPVWAGPVEASAIGNMLVQFMAQGQCADLQEDAPIIGGVIPSASLCTESE